MAYLYIIDEAGQEVDGSRRTVDYDGDPAHYFRMKAELEAAMGEGCSVMDSDLDSAAW